jgi:hypothetical protein
MLLDFDALFPPARKFARDRARIQLFPVLVQNQPKNDSTGQRVAAHTSGDTNRPESVFL